MANWKDVIRHLGLSIETHFDELKRNLKQRMGAIDPVLLLPYRGHGTRHKLYLKGRVLEDKGLVAATDNDTIWDNLLATYRRFESDELANVRLRVEFQNLVENVVTDEEGYFELYLQPTKPLPPEVIWHPVTVRLLDEIVPQQGAVQTTAEVMVPPPSSNLGIISDIDDTILQTHATQLLKVARLTFLGNARTRLPFEGVAAFYRALCQGPDEATHNPIFYVSSSPWNLYDLLVDFMQLQEIPKGPLFLRDIGFDEEKVLQSGHRAHKMEQVKHILTIHERLSFVLIGDSGQKDPEIYRDVVKAFPGRIAAIYIRDVSSGERGQEVAAIAAELRAEGVDMLLVPDTAAAAKHAAGQGFIHPNALDDIRNEAAADADGELEQLLE